VYKLAVGSKVKRGIERQTTGSAGNTAWEKKGKSGCPKYNE
jgi:hypothetical protein